MQFSDTQDDFYQLNYEWYKAKLKRFNESDQYRDELEYLCETLFGLPNIETVLDYGCGTGYGMMIASRWFDMYGYDRFDYYEGDRRKYNQPFIMFDAIYLMHSINHIPDLSQAARSIHSKLKPGGYVMVATPNPPQLAKDYKPDPTVIQYLTREDISNLFEANGFKFANSVMNRKTKRLLITFQKK